MQISSPNLWRAADLRALSIWRNSGAGNGRESVYLLIFGVLCPPQVVVRCFRIFTAIAEGSKTSLGRAKARTRLGLAPSFKDRPSVPIIYNLEVRSTFLWKARTSAANVFGHFLFLNFAFLKPLLCWHVPYIFIGVAFDLPSTFFPFLQHVFSLTQFLSIHFKIHN